MSLDPISGSSPNQEQPVKTTSLDLSKVEDTKLKDFLKENGNEGFFERFSSHTTESLKNRVLEAFKAPKGVTLTALKTLGLTGKVDLKNLKYNHPDGNKVLFSGTYNIDKNVGEEGIWEFSCGDRFKGNGTTTLGTYYKANGNQFTIENKDENNLPSKGKCLFKNGDSYEGIFSSKRFGTDSYNLNFNKGAYTWADGRIFEGRFKGFDPVEGTLTWPDDSYYKGNLQEGKGTYFVEREDGSQSIMSATYEEVKKMRGDQAGDLTTQRIQ